MLYIRTLFGVSQLGPYSLTGVGFIGLGSTYKCGRCMTILVCACVCVHACVICGQSTIGGD